MVPAVTSPLAVFACSFSATFSSDTPRGGVSPETSPRSPGTGMSAEPLPKSRLDPGGQVMRTSTSPPQLIWIGPQRILSLCSIVTRWPSRYGSALISIASIASVPRRPVEMTSTVVRGSSTVVTTTRPLGSRIWRETLPGVSKTCIYAALALDLALRGAADPTSGRDLPRLADAVAGVEECGVVEGEW